MLNKKKLKTAIKRSLFEMLIYMQKTIQFYNSFLFKKFNKKFVEIETTQSIFLFT